MLFTARHVTRSNSPNAPYAQFIYRSNSPSESPGRGPISEYETSQLKVYGARIRVLFARIQLKRQHLKQRGCKLVKTNTAVRTIWYDLHLHCLLAAARKGLLIRIALITPSQLGREANTMHVVREERAGGGCTNRIDAPRCARRHLAVRGFCDISVVYVESLCSLIGVCTTQLQ